MEALRWLTLGYAVVLVLALAVSLIAILVQLWRIGTVLAEIGAALTEVRTSTTPLSSYLKALHDAFVDVGAG